MEISESENNKLAEKDIFKMVQKFKTTFQRLMSKDQHPVIEADYDKRRFGDEMGKFFVFLL